MNVAVVLTKPRTVLLVDDHAIVRHAIKTMLEATKAYTVVAESADADEAVVLARDLKPDLVLLDIGLPKKSGMEALYEIKQLGLPSKLVILTMYEDEQKVRQAVSAGAHGYILKNSSVQKFQEALEKVFQGKLSLPESFEHLFSNESGTIVSSSALALNTDPLAELSKREREVFYLLADGMPNRIIAKKLFISPRTVETHRARVIKKLNCNSTADLIRYAIRNNLLSL